VSAHEVSDTAVPHEVSDTAASTPSPMCLARFNARCPIRRPGSGRVLAHPGSRTHASSTAKRCDAAKSAACHLGRQGEVRRVSVLSRFPGE